MPRSIHNYKYCCRLIIFALQVTSFSLISCVSSMSSKAITNHHRVAVVGGGITGCAVARQLLAEDETIHVTLFDWGRTVGGRSSHRFRPEASTANPDGEKSLTLHFDHGAQLLHATDETFLAMVRPALQKWPKDTNRLGWLDSITGTFTSSANAATAAGSSTNNKGFFGACDPSLDDNRFVGVGGMNAIANEILRGATEMAPSRLQIHEMTRVARCEKIEMSSSSTNTTKGWKLFGDGLGHEQANAKALQQSTEQELGEFDELVLTDHMAAAMPSWHPCHVKGLEAAVPALVSSLRTALDWDESNRRFRTVQPLFSCMVALQQTMELGFDAASLDNSDVLQWVCCQDSRPHGEAKTDDKPNEDTNTIVERWVLVSTPEFAATCLGSEGMSKGRKSQQLAVDKNKTAKSSEVEYIPQTDEYLRADPADQMWDEFVRIVKASRPASKDDIQPAVLLKCQRWGAGYTEADPQKFQDIQGILEVHEEEEVIAVCGDFTHTGRKSDDAQQSASSNSFVMQNAALSGINTAKRIADRLKSK